MLLISVLGAQLKKTLAIFVCSLAFLNPITILPASASSCLSKADQAAMSGSNFDFLYMENCYKALGLSSTESNCSSILGSASNLYKLDWDKDAFRRVMQYDSCRETISIQPKPIPRPSEDSGKPTVPVVPVVPVKPVVPKQAKCTSVPVASSVKLVYGKNSDYLVNESNYLYPSTDPRYEIGGVGHLHIRTSHSVTSKNSTTGLGFEIRTLNLNGKWSGWRDSGGGSELVGYNGSYHHFVSVWTNDWTYADGSLASKGVKMHPADVQRVRVRVILTNNCGNTKWIELTKSSGVTLFDPKLGKPSLITCREPNSINNPRVDILGFGVSCQDYSKWDPDPGLPN